MEEAMEPVREYKKPRKARSNSRSQDELQKASEKIEAFEAEMKETLSQRDFSKEPEHEPITKMSQREMQGAKDLYLKPSRSIYGRGERFNEKFREDYEFDKQYVKFVADHREIIGETIEIWTKKYPGTAAEFWEVPSGKPVWGPRYLAEQIKKCNYRRLKMNESTNIGSDHIGSYTGQLIVDQVVARLEATPVSSGRSVFV